LDVADEPTVAGAPAFLLAVFFMVGMIGVVIGCMRTLVGGLFKEMKMVSRVRISFASRIVRMAAKSQSRQ
jgi:hypothetical protein